MVLKTKNSNVPAITFCVITGIFPATFNVSASHSCKSPFHAGKKTGCSMIPAENCPKGSSVLLQGLLLSGQLQQFLLVVQGQVKS